MPPIVPVGTNSWPTGPLRAGPMVGEVGEHDAFVWVQARDAIALTLTLRKPDGTTASFACVPLAANALCAVFHVTGLTPGVAYSYTIAAGGGVTPSYTLRAGLSHDATRARIVVASCFQLPATGPVAIFQTIAAERADAFVMAGDNSYLPQDTAPTMSADAMTAVHLTYRNVDPLRAVVSTTSTLGIWDDHDFGTNDCQADFPAAAASMAAYRRMWAQRTYGLTGPGAGIFSSARYGPVEIFLTDGRWFRRDGTQILGRAQLDWLKAALVASTASIKLVVSGSVVLPEFVRTIEGGSWEGWARDAHAERSELFGHIEGNDVRGVVFASGDLHLGYLMHRPGFAIAGNRRGPDYWELVSSPLTSPIWGTRVRAGPNAPTYDPYCLDEVTTQNYGIVDVDLGRTGREVTLTLKNGAGGVIASRAVSRETLRLRPAPAKLTAVMWPNGRAYFFRGDRYVRYDPDPAHEGAEPGYPRTIESGWPGMTGYFARDLDAAVVWPNGKAYFFRGNGYVRYTLDPAQEGVDAGYPDYVTSAWPGLWRDGVDAAVVWPNGSAYFFRGAEYVRYDMDPAHDGVEPGYPKPIADHWPGLAAAFPDGVDAVIVWPNGKAYFFKGDRYARYTTDPAHEGVDPGYPQPIAGHWPGLDTLFAAP